MLRRVTGFVREESNDSRLRLRQGPRLMSKPDFGSAAAVTGLDLVAASRLSGPGEATAKIRSKIFKLNRLLEVMPYPPTVSST